MTTAKRRAVGQAEGPWKSRPRPSRTGPWRRVLPVLVLLVGSVGEIAAQTDSLSLERALEVGRSRSPTLIEAEAAVRAAQGGLLIARSASRPTVTTDAGYVRYEDPPAIDIGALGTLTVLDANTYFAGIRADQLLFTSGRLTAARDAARATVEAAEWARTQTEVELTAAIAEAYYDALLAEALARVAVESAAVLRRARDVSEAHFAEGTVARLDVLRAEGAVSEAEAAVRTARDAAAGARERLAAAIGIRPQHAPPLEGRLVSPRGAETEPAERPLAGQIRERPDLRALEANVAAQRARATGARARRRPALGVYVAGYALNPELLTTDSGWGLEVAAGIAVSWSFFDGGRGRGEEAVARARAESMEARIEQAVLAAATAARAHERDIRRALADIDAGAATVSRAERALTIAEERYARGVGIQLDILESEAALTRARANQLRAIHAYRTAVIRLKRDLGVPADATVPINGGDGA